MGNISQLLDGSLLIKALSEIWIEIQQFSHQGREFENNVGKIAILCPCLRGDDTLSEPMMALFIDAYVHHKIS